MTDLCPRCGHDWHGLPCQDRSNRGPFGNFRLGPPCGCVPPRPEEEHD